MFYLARYCRKGRFRKHAPHCVNGNMLMLWNAFGCAAAVLPTLSSWILLTLPQLRYKAGSQSSSRARALKLTSSPLSSEGGEFTRQTEVTFLPRNERLTIRQEFKGIDEHDHLVMSTTVEGRVPELPHGATLQIEPYSEIYQYSNNCKKHYEQRIRRAPGPAFEISTQQVKKLWATCLLPAYHSFQWSPHPPPANM